MAYKPEDFPLFTIPESSIVKAWVTKLKDYSHNIVSVLGIQARSEVKVDRYILYEIFTRACSHYEKGYKYRQEK